MDPSTTDQEYLKRNQETVRAAYGTTVMFSGNQAKTKREKLVIAQDVEVRQP